MAVAHAQLQVPSSDPSMAHALNEDDDGFSIYADIRQDPLSITLDGPAIFTSATCLILSVHFFQPSVMTILVSSALILLFIRHDYKNYLQLGPGGTPATFQGYIRISWFKLWALRDPFEPPVRDPTREPLSGILSRSPLPCRDGPRPTVAGIAPQRQVDQHGPRDCYLALRKILKNHGQMNSETIGIGTSCFEKHGLGLFARLPVNNTCQGEICHVHNSDHSMHMNLHPDDAREVLQKGWGQRHPLACSGWLPMPVPEQFVMIYSPRTVEEVVVVCRIIEAAEWWVTARQSRIDTTVV